MNNFKKCIALIVSFTFILTSFSPALAADSATSGPEVVAAAQTVDRIEDGAGGVETVLDLLLVRPVGVVTTLGGVVLFFCALPFTIPSNSVNRAAGSLMVTPGNYTFKRPLGKFESYPQVGAMY